MSLLPFNVAMGSVSKNGKDLTENTQESQYLTAKYDNMLVKYKMKIY